MVIRVAAWVFAGIGFGITHSFAMAQDVSVGRTAFAQCAACHSVNGANGVGPSLQGVLGRRAGTFPAFRYSRAMKNSGITWNAKILESYLADPQKIVPGNVMPFSGVADAKQRADLVAYLATLK